MPCSFCNARIRSIPAWAGEPSHGLCMAEYLSVYPRVGGGTAVPRSGATLSLGLSPRGRGNLRMHWRNDITERSIPAWAGEPHHRAACHPF